jgi:peptide/nickel transport system substrate-binding protein
MATMSKAIAGAYILAPATCGASHAQSPKTGGILKFAVVAEPPSMDCHAVNTFAFIHPVRAHYSTLLTFKGSFADLRIAGDLASSWEVPEDGLSYTFKLRDNVKFHDGSSLTSEDVKVSCARPR